MHYFFLFTLLSTFRLIPINVKAIAIQLGSLERRENLENDEDMFANFENLSPASGDLSLWNDEFDLASVPGCSEPQSSLDSGNLFDLGNLFSSSDIDDNNPLIGRGLEEFSTQLDNFAAPLKTLSNPACINQDFQFRTPPQGSTNTDEGGKSTDQQDQNPKPEAPLEDLLSPLQLELEPKCPQDPDYGYVEDLCCFAGPFGLYYIDCVRCKFLTSIVNKWLRISVSIPMLITNRGLDTPANPVCLWNRLCCRVFNRPVSVSIQFSTGESFLFY